MSEQRPERVRVTGPPQRAPARGQTRLGDVRELTPLGGVYLRSLLREQFLLSVRVLVLLAVTLGSLPLVFHLAPGLAEVSVLGLPVAWVALGVVVYPALVLVGWAYVRVAERNERDFAHLVSQPPEPRDEEPL